MLLNIAKLSLLLFTSVFLLSFSAAADGFKPYSEDALEEAQAEGKTVLVDFYAPWCSTCRAQHSRAFPGILADDKFTDVKFLKVDFDNDEEAKRKFGVTKQSTLVVFRGEKEVARATGLTSEKQIRELIEKGL